jgi:MtN3 and saliva related transmembrane protein
MYPIITKAIGFLAGIGTTVSFFPQMIRVIRTKSVSDLSIYMFLIHSTGVSLWVAYGVLVDDVIIILFNCITVVFNMVILSFFIRDFMLKPSQIVINECEEGFPQQRSIGS